MNFPTQRPCAEGCGRIATNRGGRAVCKECQREKRREESRRTTRRTSAKRTAARAANPRMCRYGCGRPARSQFKSLAVCEECKGEARRRRENTSWCQLCDTSIRAGATLCRTCADTTRPRCGCGAWVAKRDDVCRLCRDGIEKPKVGVPTGSICRGGGRRECTITARPHSHCQTCGWVLPPGDSRCIACRAEEQRQHVTEELLGDLLAATLAA